MARTRTQQAAIATLVLAAVAAAVVALVSMDPTGARGPRTGSNYVRDVLQTQPVDAALLTWAEGTPLPAGMASPRALCVDGAGRIVVVGDRVAVLAPDGAKAKVSAPLSVTYHAVAVDAAGRAFAAARAAVDQLDLEDAEPKVTAHLGLDGKGTNLTGIAVTAHGLYVADAGRCTVLRLPRRDDGGLDAEGAPAPFAKGFFVPSEMELASAADGELIAVDPGRHQVQWRDVYGDVVAKFGAEGGGIADFHGCCNPTAVAPFADGRLVTAEKGLAATRVKVYDGKGQLLSVVADGAAFDLPADGPPLLLDVAIDAQGRVLVLDPGRRQVRVFAPKEKGR